MEANKNLKYDPEISLSVKSENTEQKKSRKKSEVWNKKKSCTKIQKKKILQ